MSVPGIKFCQANPVMKTCEAMAPLDFVLNGSIGFFVRSCSNEHLWDSFGIVDG